MGKVFPGVPDCEESACNAGDPASIPRLRYTLEKVMTIHFRNFAWKIPWIGASIRLKAMGLREARQD